MAEITNGRNGPARLAVEVDMLRKEPDRGMVAREQVSMNSHLGLLWANVTLWVGEEAVYSQEVLLHSLDLRNWTQQVENLFCGKAPELSRLETRYGFIRQVRMDISSPELLLHAQQHVHTPEKRREAYGIDPQIETYTELVNALAEQLPVEEARREARELMHPSFHYDLLVVVDTSIAAGECGVAEEGPAIFLQPTGEELRRFARDLRSETEIALLLGSEAAPD